MRYESRARRDLGRAAAVEADALRVAQVASSAFFSAGTCRRAARGSKNPSRLHDHDDFARAKRLLVFGLR
jgi:hypothetical protein